jgi:predicted dehydrogenase
MGNGNKIHNPTNQKPSQIMKIKVGLAGCGYWGGKLLDKFRSVPGCEVKMVCDSNRQTLDQLAGKHPEIQFTTQFPRLMNGVGLDALVIATRTNTHFAYAKEALERGIHVWLEKPMASTAEECAKLNELAHKHKRILMVDHTFLYSAAVEKIREIIRMGQIGSLRHINCRRLDLGRFHLDVNVAYDLAPHDISIIDYVMGGEKPTHVSCTGYSFINPENPDVTTITLYYKSGCIATITSSWVNPLKVRQMDFIGDKAMIHYDDTLDKGKVSVHNRSAKMVSGVYVVRDEGTNIPRQDQVVEPLIAAANHFINCINTKSSPRTHGGQGEYVLRVLEAAKESFCRGGVKIPLIPMILPPADVRSGIILRT